MGCTCTNDDRQFIERLTTQFEWKRHMSEQDFEDLSHILKERLSSSSTCCCWKKKILISSSIPPLNQQNTGNGFLYVPFKFGYYGSIRDGLPHGKGAIYFKNKEAYRGQFSNGKIHGQGSSFDSDDNLIFRGFWENGKFATGEYYGFVSSTYIRKVEKRKQNSYTIKYLDDSKYTGQGEILPNKTFVRKGQGTFILGSKQYSYIGGWKDNKKHGSGRQIFTTPEGLQQFQGFFQNDQKKGQGKYTFPNKDYLQGEWSDDHTFSGLYYRFGHSKQVFRMNQDGIIQSSNISDI